MPQIRRKRVPQKRQNQETPTETETESETETEETTEEETEGPGDPVDREKVETHLIIASDTHYMSPSMTGLRRGV
ncbi:MAG: hypothetical protein ACLUD2_21405 [Clostridium sp.]